MNIKSYNFKSDWFQQSVCWYFQYNYCTINHIKSLLYDILMFSFGPCTVKTALVKNLIICLYKEFHNTVCNKGDLDSFIKTKNSILAL